MKKLKYNILAISLLWLGSCSTQGDGVGEVVPANGRLTFDVEVASSSLTRADITTDENQTSTFTKFGIYAVATADNSKYLENERVNYDAADGSWHTVKAVPYWPVGAVNFFGYAPYGNLNIECSVDENSQMVLKYNNPTTHEKQVDLMIATPAEMQQIGSVPMTFNHSLSAIAFRIVGDGNFKAKEIGFKGINDSGKVSCSSEGEIIWSDCGKSNHLSSMKLYENNIPEIDNDILTAEDGAYLMMLPMDDMSDVEAVVTIANADTGEEMVLSASVPTSKNWQAGNIYTYRITLVDLNTIDFDPVVEVTQWVESTENDLDVTAHPTPGALEVSNCYMLNSALPSREFYIPVSERIDDFYTDYLGYTEQKSIEYSLGVGDEWNADLVWSYGSDEFEAAIDNAFAAGELFKVLTSEELSALERKDRVTAATCKNNFATKNSRAVLKVTLPEGIKEGNLLFAVRKNINGVSTLLWSWHLWITEYNPNMEPTATSIDGQFEVDNGHVQRYTDSAEQSPAVWGEGGIYEGKYIMDRNIGMAGFNKSAKLDDLIYYNFNRKDPFTYWEECSFGAGYNDDIIYSNEPGITPLTSVLNPDNRFRSNTLSYAWCKTEAAKDPTLLWADPNVEYDLLADENTQQKSIFDPSPLGWKIPVQEVWTGLLEALNDPERRNYVNKSFDTGDPYAMGMLVDDYVFLPFCGYYTTSDMSDPDYATIRSTTSYNTMYLWGANNSKASSSITYGSVLRVYMYGSNPKDSSAISIYYFGKNAGCPIRCIQE